MQASIPVGTLVGGRWQITGVLGEGGFGQVLLAEDTSEVALGEAAVKVLHPGTTPQERADFLTEVKKIATLRHPNLVGYLDSGQLQLPADGASRPYDEVRPFLVTERCAMSLSDHGRRSAPGHLPPAETLSVLADVAAGLAHLHQQGLIHRDIKPGNVLWSNGRWKLADFGLMRDLSATGSYHRAGTLIGTPLFMAPELFSALSATPASDIYAMGVLTHVCATGRHLHTGAGPILVHNVATQPPAIDPGLHPALHGIVSRCTHPDPALRPTAAELVDLVAAAQRGEVPYGYPAPTPSGPSSGPYGSTPSPGSAMPPAAAVPAPSNWPYGPPAASPGGHRPAGPWGPPGGGGAVDGRPPAATPRPRAGVMVAGSLAGLVLVAAMGAGLWALTGGDENAGRSVVADTIATVSVPVATGPGGSRPNVEIGNGVTLGPGVVIGTGTTGASGSAIDALSHVIGPACEASGAKPALIRVVNSADTAVGYSLHSYQFDAAGVRVGEAYDSVVGVAPGQGAWLNVASTDETVVRCEIESLTATPMPGAVAADAANVTIKSCELDTFYGDYYDITFTVTNPGATAMNASVTFSVVDADGAIIDQSFERTVYDIPPAGTVQDETGDFYNNIELVGRPGDRCVVSAVSFTTP